MYRKGLAYVLVTVLSLSLAVPGLVAAATFPDVPKDHWAYDSVEELAALGLVEGFPDGEFKGEETFTRYEMAQVFARMVKLLQKRLDENMDNKLAADRAGLEKQIAAAAKDAQEALAKAIAAAAAAAKAQETADIANANAAQAQSAADMANAAAKQAQANADSANAVAQMAQAAAQKAQQDADAANAALAELKRRANASAQDIINAQKAADEANRIAAETKQVAADSARAAAIAQEKADAASAEAVKAQATAEAANANAAKAQEVANSAAATANQAQATADAAAAVARQAQATADATASAARQMQIAAEDAAAIAKQAQAIAEANKVFAQKAQETANEALAAALKAQKEADAANATLNALKNANAPAIDILNAQKAAEEANQLAAEAKQVAAEANKLAEDAQKAAKAASEEAAKAHAAAVSAAAAVEKAQATADTAASNAEKAQSIAEKALADAIKAHANAEKAIADAAKAQTKAADAEQLAQAAYNLASAAKTQADQLALKAGIEPIQVSEVIVKDSSVADEIKALAEEALATANQAKKLAEDNSTADAAMAKAEEAYKLAVAADSRAKAAQANLDAALQQVPKEFVLDDAARKAIDEYVADLVIKELNDIRANASELAKRVTELEENAITATDAEFIAAQIVSKQLYDVLGRITSLEMAQQAIEGDIAAIRSMLNEKTAALADSIEKLSAEYKEELKALGVEVADLRFGMGKLEERIIALEAQNDMLNRLLASQELQTQRLGAQLQSNYSALDEKIAKNAEAIASLERQVSALKSESANISSDLAATRRELNATKSDLAETKALVAGLQTDLSGTKQEVAKLQAGLNDAKQDIAQLQSGLSATQNEVAQVKADLSNTKQDVAALQSVLAPIKAKFDSTKVGLSVDLVTRRVGLSGGNSLYVDPREPILSQEKKATAGDWYNNRIAASQENYILYGFDVFTVPSPGSTLSAKIYAKRWDVPVVNKWQPGIEMDLTTQGILRSFHVGELTSEVTAGFSKFVLDPEKWQSQIFRMDGFHALLQSNAGISANILLGHGNIKPIDLTNKGNDLPGMDTTDLVAASVDVPLGPILNLRGSWLNVPVYSGNAPISVGAVEAFGNWKAFSYSATVASSDTLANTPVAELKLAFDYGKFGWQAEYLYTNWKQRFAQADVDGLTVGAKQTYAFEFHGLNLAGFEFMGARRFQWTAGKQNAWLVRAERDFASGFSMVGEVGRHGNEYHTMLDFGLNDVQLLPAPFSFDFGYRMETLPILSEGWTQRWTNIESNPSRVDQNWVLGSYINEARAKATLSFTDKSYAYSGAKWRTQDFVKDVITNSGIVVGTEVFGGEATMSYELETTMFNPSKSTIGFAYTKPLGVGSINANIKASIGQGTDLANRRDGVGELRLSLPIYDNTTFHVDGNYYGSFEPGKYWYNHTSWRIGLDMIF